MICLGARLQQEIMMMTYEGGNNKIHLDSLRDDNHSSLLNTYNMRR